MAVIPRGSKFEVAFMYKRHRHSKAFATADEGTAWEEWARAELQAGRPLDDGKKGADAGPTTNIGALVSYVAQNHWAGKKSAPDLIRNATLYAAWCGAETPIKAALHTLKVNEYCRDMEARSRSAATVNRHLSAVSVLARYAKSLGALADAPLLTWQAEGEGRLRYLSEEEEGALLAHVRFIGRADDAVFYEFLLDSGARLSEALKAEWRDFSSGFGTVTFHDTKNGTNRTVPLTGRVKAGLTALKCGPKGSLRGPFAEVSKGGQTAFWRRLQTRLPFLADCVPHHVFRHTTASRLVGRGIDLYRIKTFMGHASVSTTERYAHLAKDHMAELAKALEGVG